MRHVSSLYFNCSVRYSYNALKTQYYYPDLKDQYAPLTYSLWAIHFQESMNNVSENIPARPISSEPSFSDMAKIYFYLLLQFFTFQILPFARIIKSYKNGSFRISTFVIWLAIHFQESMNIVAEHIPPRPISSAHDYCNFQRYFPNQAIVKTTI